MLFAKGISPFLGAGGGHAILREYGYGSQIVFEGAGEISGVFLDLAGDDKMPGRSRRQSPWEGFAV